MSLRTHGARRGAMFGPVVGVLCVVGLTAPAWGGAEETTLCRHVAWQAALESVGLSPGLIDGRIGPKTRLATREFQRVRGLEVTGELDDATLRALEVDPDDALVRYTLDPADFAEIGPVPKGWRAKARLETLGHESIETALAEKFHCHRRLLATLNPGRNLRRLKAGDKVIVPRVREPTNPMAVDHLEINLSEKVIRVVDREKRLAALFYCSVAARKAKVPTRDTHVVSITPDPWYTFDPKMWPEVKEKVSRVLKIPPGPRNPVGRCWIALGLPGYGMHGTPNPELIGKTGSHGCFRLTNWDAIRLSKMVRPDTPVRFVGHPDVKIASRRR